MMDPNSWGPRLISLRLERGDCSPILAGGFSRLEVFWRDGSHLRSLQANGHRAKRPKIKQTLDTRTVT